MWKYRKAKTWDSLKTNIKTYTIFTKYRYLRASVTWSYVDCSFVIHIVFIFIIFIHGNLCYPYIVIYNKSIIIVIIHIYIHFWYNCVNIAFLLYILIWHVSIFYFNFICLHVWNEDNHQYTCCKAFWVTWQDGYAWLVVITNRGNYLHI